jgi:uncharacterized protein (DUF1015 family)
VYEQRWGDKSRTGVFFAGEVTPYEQGQIIRHEKTFDEKVKGRIALREATGHTFGPVFLLTRHRGKLSPILERAKDEAPLYSFTSDFGGASELHGIENRVWRVPQTSADGEALMAMLAPEPLYIADGHHRYHAALKSGQGFFLGYVTEDAEIEAYNRVIRGTRPFEEAKAELPLTPVTEFQTPEKHRFRIHTRDGDYELAAQEVPDDVVGRLDCAILERELYPKLGLSHDLIKDPRYFDYYPESALDQMKVVVDRGDYDLAVALHPVSREELIAVADAGLEDSSIVMPEKSTFFAPKILTGVMVFDHRS